MPVVRNVQDMSYADIEKTIAALGEKAKRGAIDVEDMDGGTFTVSNGGVFGSLMGTPIINPPQSAILGMHGIFERPIAVKGQVNIKFSFSFSTFKHFLTYVYSPPILGCHKTHDVHSSNIRSQTRRWP